MAALKYVIMEKKGKEGKPLKGMFIPIEANRLQEHKSGGVYLNLVAFELKAPTDYATHTIKQSFSKKEREEMGEEVLNKLPFLGNIKVSDGTPPAQDNNAAPDKVVDADGDDDLPF